MYNFTEGAKVKVAYAHESSFAGEAGGGNLPATLTLEVGSKVKSMTLFTSFLLVTTKTGANIAMPVTNFKTIVLS